MALVKTVTYSTLLSPSTSSSTAKEGPFQLLRQPVIAPSSKLPQAMRFSSEPAAVRTRSSKQIAPSNLPNTSCKQSSGKAASHVHFIVVHSLATGFSARYCRSLDPPHSFLLSEAFQIGQRATTPSLSLPLTFTDKVYVTPCCRGVGKS